MPNPTRRMQHLFYRFEDYKEKNSSQLCSLRHQDNSCVMDSNYFAKLYSDDMYIEPTPVTAVVKWRSPLISEQEVWNLLKVAEHSFAGGQR